MLMYRCILRCCLVLALIAGSVAPVLGQNNGVAESLMTKHVPSCFDIQYNCVLLIPQLHARNAGDTIEQLMAYWSDHCGKGPFWLAYSILSSIETGRFADTSYDGTYVLRGLLQFADRSKMLTTARAHTTGNYNTDAGDGAYVHFINDLAARLSQRQGLSAMERYFTAFYASPDEAFLSRLTDNSFAAARLRAVYDSLQRRARKQWRTEVTAVSGIWLPNGNLSTVGNHPYLGLQVGRVQERIELLLDVNFKFRDAPNSFLVRKDDSVYSSNHFFGGYIGLDGGYAVLKGRKHQCDALAGIAFDGADLLNIDASTTKNKITKSANSFNFNLGIGYRFFMQGTYFIGIQAKYHFIHYPNEGGTDLSGNACTVGLVVGFAELLPPRSSYFW